MTTQDVRRALNKSKYVPLTKIQDCEVWVKGPHRINLIWEGEYPEKAKGYELQFARIERGRIIPCLVK